MFFIDLIYFRMIRRPWTTDREIQMKSNYVAGNFMITDYAQAKETTANQTMDLNLK